MISTRQVSTHFRRSAKRPADALWRKEIEPATIRIMRKFAASDRKSQGRYIR
jgi:hypothetical protein